MRDRLASLLSEAEGLVNNDLPTVEQIADYLLEHGVIVPPCKVGQTVWFMSGVLEEVCEAKVVRISMNYYTDPPLWFEFEFFSKLIGTQTMIGRIDLYLGNTLFLTREEAEKALAERRAE